MSQCSPIASASPTLQGTTVRREQKIQRHSHNLPLTLLTSNFCVLGRVYFTLSMNEMEFYSLAISEQLFHISDTRFPCTTTDISPAVRSMLASPLIPMYSQNHCAHRDQFIFPSPVASFILCRKKLAASNKECYE